MNLSRVLGRQYWGVMIGLGLAGLLVNGCASGSQGRGSASQDKVFADVPGMTGVPGAAPAPAVAAPAAGTRSVDTNNPDMIHAGQPVLITFSDMPMVQQPIVDEVKEDGTLTLLQNKTFVAAGKTRRQLEEEVHDFYVPQYFKQMTVSIQPQYQSRFYYVDGEVKQPGRQVYIGPTTMLKTIASAGGFTDFAARTKVKLIHLDGRVQIVNCKRAINKPQLDLPVYPDDKVIVPRRLLW